MEINGTEFWILDQLWDDPSYFSPCAFRSTSYLGEHLGCGVPKHTLNERCAAFLRLFDAGLIQILTDEGHCEIDRTVALNTIEQYRNTQYQSDRSPLFFDLFATGAAAWEQLASPTWDNYFEEQWQEPPAGSSKKIQCHLFTASTHTRLEKQFSFLRHHMWFSFWNPKIIDEGVRRPWVVNQWKQLPEGYWSRVCFKHKTVSGDYYPVIPDDNMRRKLYNWRLNGFSSIYCTNEVRDNTWSQMMKKGSGVQISKLAGERCDDRTPHGLPILKFEHPTPEPHGTLSQRNPQTKVRRTESKPHDDRCWHPCRDAKQLIGAAYRWSRCAQPPGNRCEASGFKTNCGVSPDAQLGLPLVDPSHPAVPVWIGVTVKASRSRESVATCQDARGRRRRVGLSGSA